MTEENPFDLTDVAKQYGWKDAKDMRIIIDVKQARGGADCYNQLYCWMRDHFERVAKLEMIESMDGKVILESGKTELEELHENFQNIWNKVVNYEDVINA